MISTCVHDDATSNHSPLTDFQVFQSKAPQESPLTSKPQTLSPQRKNLDSRTEDKTASQKCV